MSDAIRVSGSINAAGLEMSLETGKLAPQADGAVLVRVGDTVILSTVVTSKPREGERRLSVATARPARSRRRIRTATTGNRHALANRP